MITNKKAWDEIVENKSERNKQKIIEVLLRDRGDTLNFVHP